MKKEEMEKKIELKKYFSFPFKYDHENGFVLDNNNNLIAEVRGWSTISKYFGLAEEANKVQDTIGKFLAQSLNNIADCTESQAENERLKTELKEALTEISNLRLRLSMKDTGDHSRQYYDPPYNVIP